jgi:hypothetical protein
VAVAEREVQVLALHRRTVTDAVDLELALETLGDAGDQIVHERTRKTPGSLVLLFFALFLEADLVAVELRRHVVVDHDRKFALRAFDLDGLARDVRGDSRRNGDGAFADFGHDPVTPQNTVQRISPPTFWSRAS